MMAGVLNDWAELDDRTRSPWTVLVDMTRADFRHKSLLLVPRMRKPERTTGTL